MYVEGLHHTIMACQRQIETLTAAVASPAPSQGILMAGLEVLHASLAALQGAEAMLHHQQEDLAVAHQTSAVAQQRYQALLDLALEAYLVTDSRGRIQEANRPAATLLATPQPALAGQPLADFVRPEERQAFCAYVAALTTFQDIQDWDICLHPPGGQPVQATLRVLPMRFQDQHVVLLWCIRDHTARHQDEGVLRDAEARQQAILQTAVDGIITIDTHGIIESFNPAAERLFGYPAAAVIGQNIAMLMPSPYREEHDGYLAHYLRTGEQRIIGIGREVLAQRRDGATFPIALAVSEMHLEGRRMFTGIVHDLTARVQAEEALRQARDELEQRVHERTAALTVANEEIKRFAYIVSHDLRAPLINLKGFASELRIACTGLQDALPAVRSYLDATQLATVSQALDDAIPEALGFIETSVTRMDRLIQAILHLSRLGRRDLCYELLDMRALVQGTIHTLAHQIAQRQAQVTIDPLPPVMADRTAMEQIMGNLLANAVTYLVPGRPGTIVVTGEHRPEATIFTVCDNGRGIAAEDIPKVFEPFRRVGRQDVPGEGMGLAYVQMLVQRHGGDIQCHSTLGVGTTLTCTIAHQPPGGERHAG